MRAFQLVAPGVTELREVDTPVPGAGQVLLKVTGAGVCHSDLHILHAPATVFPTPMTFGHEVSGTVALAGEGVVGWEEGTPALVYICWGCGRCSACLVGAENYCRAYPRSTVPGGGLGLDGGMADYVVVPARHLVPLGDLDPIAATPLTDAGLTPYHAIAQARSRLNPSSTAVVIGVGGLGHVGLQILKATTGATVIAVDTDEARLAQATELGADHVLLAETNTATDILALTNQVGADAIFDFVGLDSTLDIAGNAVRSAGQIMLVGLGGGTLPMSAIGMAAPVPWGVTVQKPYGGTRRDLAEVVALAAAGRIHVAATAFPLDDAAKVFAQLERGEILGRAVLVP
ncbi:MAG: alcohol dehydrogenase catalytic domain-containing protein [Acidimicrobiia bacterium]